MFEKRKDALSKRVNNLSNRVSKVFEGTKPFDKEPESVREQLFQYMNTPDEQKAMARQEFGLAYDVYEKRMEDAKRRLVI
jgi:cytochrome c556